MAVSLRPYPPPPSSLMAVEIKQTNKQKRPKVIFFLMASALPPPPLNGTAIKKIFFLRLPFYTSDSPSVMTVLVDRLSMWSGSFV